MTPESGRASRAPPASFAWQEEPTIRISSRHLLCLLASLAALTGALKAQEPEPSKAPIPDRLAFAVYRYWFQGDGRLPEAGHKVRRPDGSIALAHMPVEGVGPWFSFWRARWHRRQLEDMTVTGVHSALVAYRADAESRSKWSVRGLDTLVQALKDLRRDQVDAPYVSLLLEHPLSGERDLTSERGQQALYAAIRGFYLRVPSFLRLEVPVPGGPPHQRANVVVLGAPGEGAEWNAAAFDSLRRRYLSDFGKHLVIVGVQEWQAKAAGLDGYLSLDVTTGLQVTSSDRLTIASISPGFDLRRQQPGGAHRSRRDGSPFRADWNRLSQEPAHWIVLNTWNDFLAGSAIAASREYRDREMLLARIGLAALVTSDQDHHARLLKLDAAPVMAPKGLHRVELTVENLGKRAWPGTETKVVYRVLKGDEAVTPEVRLPLPRDVAVRRRVSVAAGVPTAKLSGEPLEAGTYRLTVHLELPPAAEGGAVESLALLDMPLEVGAPRAPQITLLSSEAPVTMMAGGVYQARVRLRNDTDQAFTQAAHAVSYRWHRGDGTPLPAEGSLRTALPRDLAPGEAVEMVVSVRAAAGDHPLDLWSPAQPEGCLLEWGIADSEGAFQGGASPTLAGWEPVEPVAKDLGLDFSKTLEQRASPIDKEMVADSETEVAILVQNRGPNTWRNGEVQLGYHWYYWDGTEMIWDTGTNPRSPIDLLTGVLAPEAPAVMARFKLRAPPFGGQYWLVVEGYADGEWASASYATRSGDLYVVPVVVRGGPFVPQRLTGLFDVDGISSEADTADGDFDGAGRTFPAEAIPPEVSRYSNVYPCGYRGAVLGNGVDSSRHVPFDLPPKADSVPNFASCRGQRLELEGRRITAVHLAASAPQDAEVDFTLHYSDGMERRERVLISSWDAPPKFDEHPVLQTPYRHTVTGSEPVPAYVNHYALRADEGKQIVAVTLPAAPSVRLLAVTTEAW